MNTGPTCTTRRTRAQTRALEKEDDGRTKPVKRKASPETQSPRKRTRDSEHQLQNQKEEDLRVRLVKRKTRNDDEGPFQEKKRTRREFEVSQEDLHLAGSSNRNSESCSTSSIKRGCKRPRDSEGEGPRKRMKNFHLEESQQDATVDLAATSKTRATTTCQTRALRKASPERQGPRTRSSNFEHQLQNQKEEDLRVRVVKRKTRNDDEGPFQEKKRTRREFEVSQEDLHLAGSSSRNSESCSTSPEKKGCKRPLDSEGERPRKRTKNSHLEESQQETTVDLAATSKTRATTTCQTRALRKASPETQGPRTRSKNFEHQIQSRKEDDLRVRVLKRMTRKDKEGPFQEKKRTRREFEVSQEDLHLAGSSSRNSESCGTSSEKRGCKTPPDSEGERPQKRTKNFHFKESHQETTVDLAADPRAVFEAKYKEEGHLGSGGCGSVFGGYRKADNLPVAIKHIERDKVLCKNIVKNGVELPSEVAVMMHLKAHSAASVGASAPVSLLDWYDLGQELILVLERPIPSMDLSDYITACGGVLEEEQAKIILKQLLDAAIDLHHKKIFHRDIKVQNILIETGTDIPRVRIIDFGLSCFFKKKSIYKVFYGTSAYQPPEWSTRYAYKPQPSTVWQLGAVLYESLHGGFETKDFLKDKKRISKGFSKDCQDFLRLCLTKAPEERPTLEELQLHPWLK